ncbi:MAG: xanthine dehydrogenase family protein subunit M [Hyphomicrobiaceae bacterium]|nr:MAG: xanthine dehydrogenase family protein subunit M [Hyphomicrobiaceae bacterium]
MYEFAYVRPASLEDAVRALRMHSEAKPLAGGMSLLSAMKLRLAAPTHLVDLGRLDGLAGIAGNNQAITIGAMTRHADVAASPIVREAIPALAVLAGDIGDRQVRHRGTLGGSVANADPAACYPAAVLGLAGTIITDRRHIGSDDFFRGLYETALETDEIVAAVEFTRPARAGYMKFPHPASRFALVGVFVAEFGAGNVRVAVTGAGPRVFREARLEAALAKEFTPTVASAVAVSAEGLNSDRAASAEYRAHLVSVMAARAVAWALAPTSQS